MTEQVHGPVHSIPAVSVVPLVSVMLTLALTPTPTISPKSRFAPTVRVMETSYVCSLPTVQAKMIKKKFSHEKSVGEKITWNICFGSRQGNKTYKLRLPVCSS